MSAGSSEIWKTGEYGEPIVRWGQKGTGPGQFDFVPRPQAADGLDFGGVAVSERGTPFGNVYVADSGNDRVQEFDHDGVFIRQWGTTGTEDGQFSDPIDVAVGPTGLVYVVDDVRDDIQVFSPEGSFLSKVGSHGSGDGRLTSAGSIFVDTDGTLYALTPVTAGSRRGVPMAPSCGHSASRAPILASSIDPPMSTRTRRATSMSPSPPDADLRGLAAPLSPPGRHPAPPRRTPCGPSSSPTMTLSSSTRRTVDRGSTLAYNRVVDWPKL